MSALLDNGQLKSVIMNCSFSTEESSCSESGVGSAVGVQTRYDLAPRKSWN